MNVGKPAVTLTFPSTPEKLLISGGAGAATFPTVLGLAQVVLFKSLRLSSGSVLASVAGGASVFVAGFAASYVTIQGYALSNDWLPTATIQYSVQISNKDLLLSAATGVVVFRALGGKFSKILPSNLLQPGSFAQRAIPVNSALHASDGQKKIIQELGKQYGCHTCGRKRVAQFVADHQPPTKLNQSSNTASLQWYYPQCRSCSSLQGAALSRGRRVSVVVHPFSLRTYHIFLPIPLVLAYVKKASGQEIYHLNQAPSACVHSVPTQTGLVDAVTTSTRSKAKAQEKVEQSSYCRNGNPSFEAGLSNPLADRFPLLIVWEGLMNFLDSFHPCGRFHITIWAFTIIAALGSL